MTCKVEFKFSAQNEIAQTNNTDGIIIICGCK